MLVTEEGVILRLIGAVLDTLRLWLGERHDGHRHARVAVVEDGLGVVERGLVDRQTVGAGVSKEQFPRGLRYGSSAVVAGIERTGGGAAVGILGELVGAGQHEYFFKPRSPLNTKIHSGEVEAVKRSS